jgi:hypothetical protein
MVHPGVVMKIRNLKKTTRVRASHDSSSDAFSPKDARRIGRDRSGFQTGRWYDYVAWPPRAPSRDLPAPGYEFHIFIGGGEGLKMLNMGIDPAISMKTKDRMTICPARNQRFCRISPLFATGNHFSKVYNVLRQAFCPQILGCCILPAPKNLRAAGRVLLSTSKDILGALRSRAALLDTRGAPPIVSKSPSRAAGLFV